MEWKSISDGGEKKGGDDSARQKCDHRRENREAGDGLRMAESSFRPWESVFISFPLLRCRNLPNAPSSLPRGQLLLFSTSTFCTRA